jgi:plastocyanin
MNFSFNPNSLTVTVGTKVTWTNHDSVTHTVTANQGAFNSPVLPGSSFSFTFTKAGTYAYHCMIHPYMMATIVVH